MQNSKFKIQNSKWENLTIPGILTASSSLPAHLSLVYLCASASSVVSQKIDSLQAGKEISGRGGEWKNFSTNLHPLSLLSKRRCVH